MSTTLYKRLGESFNEPDGRLDGYINSQFSPIAPQTHYNLRSFWTTDISVPQTMLDLSFSNAFSYSGWTMDQLTARRSILGGTFKRHTQDEYSIATGGQGAATYKTQVQLDNTSQFDLDFISVSRGNEGWDVGSGITVGKDSAYRYSNSIRVALTGGVTTTVNSYFLDDLSEFMFGNYNVEMLLRAFPAQSAGAHLNLSSSFIDFGYDQTFDPAFTDSIAFSSSTTSLTSGGDVLMRFPLSYLTNSDLSHIGAIRFRLLSTGTMTFIAQAMRLVPSGWTPRPVEVDTKRNVYERAIPQNGVESSNILGRQLFDQTRPEDLTLFAQLNTGHAPSGSNVNALRVVMRYTDSQDFLRFQLTTNATANTVTLDQSISGIITTLYQGTVTLTDETDYYLVLSAIGPTAQFRIHAVNGNFLGTTIFDSGPMPTTIVTRGFVGFSFEPYNYDFTLNFLNATKASFGKFQSSVFNSRTAVISATLSSQTSLPVNLLDTTNIISSGDAYMDFGDLGQPAPSIKIVRDGTQWFGGMVQDVAGWLGDPTQVFVTGDIYPISQVRGRFRVALVDSNESVGWMGEITNLLPNQWNHFEIPISGDMIPLGFKFHIQQAGFYNDSFYIDNLGLDHLTVNWEATADNGLHWQEFRSAINTEYSGVRFLWPGTSLAVRATANADTAWLQGYKLIPHYGWGQGGRTTIPTKQFTTRDARVIGSTVAATSRSQDVRISGPAGINTTRDVRIFGQVGISASYNVFVTGTGANNTSRDVRIQGTSIVGGQPIGLLMGITSTNNVTPPPPQVSTVANVRVTGTINTTSTSNDVRVSGSLPPGSAATSTDVRITGASAVVSTAAVNITYTGTAPDIGAVQ